MTARADRLRAAVLAAVVVAALVVATGLGLAAAARYLAAPVTDDGLITLLVIGSDAGPPRGGSPLSGARADGLHLVVVSADRQRASILDFQRDSYVPVPGKGTTKINACLNAGPDNCVATLEALVGIDIDHWFLTDFRGLAAGIDAIGGLHLDVEQRLSDPFSGTDLHPGPQLLNGGQALAYSRDRKSRAGGDKGRAAAHSRMLMSLHAQLTAEQPTVTRIAELVGNLRATTVSSAGTDETLRLAYLAMSIPPGNVRAEVADAVGGRAGSASVVFLTDGAHAQFADLRDDGVLVAP